MISGNNNDKRLFSILSSSLLSKKYINIENPQLIGKAESNSKIQVNYKSDMPIWFFRHENDENEILYCFGFNDSKNIKLVLNYNSITPRSILRFFNKGWIGINIEFKNDKKRNYRFLNKNFKLQSPTNNKNIYFLMLLYDDSKDIISIISNLMSKVVYESDLNNGCLYIEDFNDEIELGNYELNSKELNSEVKYSSEDKNKLMIMFITHLSLIKMI